MGTFWHNKQMSNTKRLFFFKTNGGAVVHDLYRTR